jgi:hypothetical protein
MAQINIGATPGKAISPTFMGLSHEWGIQPWIGSSATGVDYIYRQLLKNLMAYGSGPIILRIGGDSTDTTKEPTSATTQPFAELANALGVHFYLGVNLGSNNVSLAMDQAKAYIDQMPSGSLDAIEIGNEPDRYGTNGMRTPSYTYQNYQVDFNTWKASISPLLPSSTKLMGASWAGTKWLSNIQFYDSDGATALTAFSQHYYVADGTAANPEDILLEPASATKGPAAVAAAVVTTHQYGIPFRMGEMNSLYNGGKAGISNAFESALWAVDIMFEYANVGVDGVHWHGNVDQGSYNAFNIAVGTSAGSTTYSLKSVNPLYYGLLFFQEATGNTSHLLPVSLSTDANLKAWAMVDSSGSPRLVIINKDEISEGTTSITINGYTHAQIFRLTAPSYLATTGITFAGQTFDGSTNGVIQGTQTVETATALNGTFMISMPITSAALIIFTK